MNFYSLERDSVIDGFVVSGSTDYAEALEVFVPLMGRLNIQRDALNSRFYDRLRADIVRGCVMPPVTIALIKKFESESPKMDEVVEFIDKEIRSGFVLDGIQRLNTLSRAARDEGFDPKRVLHVNFVIAGSRDRLLYRMITLNNGQRPMSARHQIEVLADSFFDFSGLEIKLIAERGGGRARSPDAFKKGDFVKGYIAYLSESVSIDNQKIIEEKMDELIAERILESDIPAKSEEFTEVVDLVGRFLNSDVLSEWIRNQNNFVGFCVGIRNSLRELQPIDAGEVERAVGNFEKAFSYIDVSKVKVGKTRRVAVSKFIADYKNSSQLDEFELLNKMSDWI